MMKEGLDQEPHQRKSVLFQIQHDPVAHLGAQEGLRCARGLALDGRWSVTLVFSGLGLEYLSRRSIGERDDISLDRFPKDVIVLGILAHAQNDHLIQENVRGITPQEGIQLGLEADVLMMF